MPIPKPDMIGIRKFYEYRYIKKLKYSEIMAIMKKPERTLNRWKNYIKQGILEKNELSTGRQETACVPDK